VRGDTHVNPFPKTTRQWNRYGDAYVLALRCVYIARKKKLDGTKKKKKLLPRGHFVVAADTISRLVCTAGIGIMNSEPLVSWRGCEYWTADWIYAIIPNRIRIFNEHFFIASRSYYFKNGFGTAIVSSTIWYIKRRKFSAKFDLIIKVNNLEFNYTSTCY
jgi:hypothetical protein